MDKTHNPEFTMMEVYVAYKDYEWMMNFVEEMIVNVCQSVFNKLEFQFEEHTINFAPPWRRVSMIDSIQEATGKNVLALSDADLIALAKQHHIELSGNESRGKIIDYLFEVLIQPSLIQPTFLTEYPIETSPLAKKHRTKPGIVERFEGFVAGREICNAFSELTDPIDQLERFREQKKALDAGDDEAQQIDEDFINALEIGMPPTAGLGIGIDRLVMLLTNQSSIRDVLFFPTMRPIEK
jgi:lysyl-tRNA synthetase class 2